MGPTENPVPLMERELTVRTEVPEEVMVKATVLDELSLTFPKLRDVGLRAIWGAEAVPVPVKVMVNVAPVVSLVMSVRPPVAIPLVLGVNVTGIASD